MVKRMNKKAAGGMYMFEKWGDFTALGFLLLGLILALLSRNSFVNYFVGILSGLIAGFMAYRRKAGMRFLIYLCIILFMVGFLITSFRVNRKILLVLMLISTYIGYKLTKKEIFHYKDQLY